MLDSIKNNTFFSKIFNEKLSKFVIYAAFAYIMWLRHLPLVYVNDDLYVAAMAGGYTLWDYFKYVFYFNGRIITDTFANFWFRYDMFYWKQFDTCVYVIAAMLFTRIFTKNRWYHALIVCVLILYFPMFYLSSAGYVSSSTNYFYPIVGILCILLYIKYILENKKVPFYVYPMLAIGIIYSTNHDQSAIALLVGLFFLLAYCVITKMEKKIIHHIGGIFIIASIVYIIYFLLPGHLGRMTGNSINELYWLPEYANWSFLDKIYHGYTTTTSNVFFNDVFLFTVLSILLCIASLRQKHPLKLFVGLVPFAGILISHYLGSTQFVSYPPNGYGMTEMMEMRWFILPFILSVIMLICLFLGIWYNVKKETNRLFMILLLVLAAGTREMMGFTPTIYASSYRTFTFFLYALLTCNLILLNDLEDDLDHKHLWYMGVGAVVALTTL